MGVRTYVHVCMHAYVGPGVTLIQVMFSPVECFCNGLADTCNNQTGVCDCYERGVAGQTCDR